MSHYKSNVRDQEFNLFEVLGVDKALGEGKYGEIDADTAREMLSEIARLAEGPVADSFADGDRNPPVFDPETHTVALPESFKKSVHAVIDGGWDMIGIDEELGGMPMPRALQWALMEHRPGRQPRGLHVRDGCRLRPDLLPPRHRGAEEVGSAGRRARLGLDHGAHRAGRRLRRRRRPHQGRRSRTTAPGTSTA